MANPDIKYVFVLMLENHSFDVMLSQASAVLPDGYVPPAGSNQYLGKTYTATSPAPTTLTTDPGHELYDTLQQLTNINPFTTNAAPKLSPYPRDQFPADFANGTGFVANYASSTDEDTGVPLPENYGDVMSCFSPVQLPVQDMLASQFCVCTNWFSSVPGPTWPNRFFLHLASSNGMDCSPTTEQIESWYEYGSAGFVCNNGSIFQALTNAGLSYNIYNDCNDDLFSSRYNASDFADDPDSSGYFKGLGWVPQVASLNGISYDASNWWLKGNFEYDLANNYSYPYTFIEPNYGNIYDNNYQGGSSQHPMDDVFGGEALLKFVYETIRNSPVWDQSLLIVTYDEHGGFYDSVPPPAGVPPGDGTTANSNLNQFGFQFDQLGVRVPALLISPLIEQGCIDPTVYDHTSVIATLNTLFGTNNNLTLTERDKNANNLLSKITLSAARTDCPTSLPNPAPASQANKMPPLTAEEIAKKDLEPLPKSGNLIGSMGILHKMHLETASNDPIVWQSIRDQFKAIKTKGDLKAYASQATREIKIKKGGAKNR